jgi:hypothetical protein
VLRTLAPYSVVLLTFASTPVRARSKSGEPAGIDGRLLRPSVDTLFAVVQSGARFDTIGYGVQSWALTGGRTNAAWVQVYRWRGRDGSTSVDSLVMEERTLRPLREARYTNLGRVHVTYSEASVHARIEPAQGQSRTLDTAFAAPVFASAEVDALVRALPLSATYATQLDLYYPFPAPVGAKRVDFKVVGSELAPMRDGRRVPCWLVAVGLPGGTNRFWVAKETRQVVQFADDEGGTTFMFRP